MERNLKSVTTSKQARSQATLTRLLDAAEELFLQNPPQDVSIADIVREGRKTGTITVEQGLKNFVKAVDKGLLKIMSKMGISTLDAYCGAQIFEALGVGQELIDLAFEQFKICAKHYREFIVHASKLNQTKCQPNTVWTCIQSVLVQLLEEYLDIKFLSGHLANNSDVDKIDINSFFARKRLFGNFGENTPNQTGGSQAGEQMAGGAQSRDG